MASSDDTSREHQGNNIKSHLDLFRSAVSKNDVAVLESLIYPGSPILSATYSPSQKTPLHLICESRFDYIDIVQRLIDLQINIDAQTIDGNTPLHSSVQSVRFLLSFDDHHIQIIQILLKRGANPNIENNNGLTPVQLALQSYKFEAVEPFVYIVKNTQFNVNVLNTMGYTLLHFVAKFGTQQCIKALVDAGADPDVVAEDTLTPVVCAIQYNRPKNVQSLLNCGASLNIFIKYENKDVSPLYYAFMLKRTECVKILAQNGADVNEVVDNCSLLEIACADNNIEVVQCLLENGADVHRKKKFVKLILQESCEFVNFERQLLRGGIESPREIPILHYAVMLKNPNIVRLLLKHGADVNYRCEPDKRDKYFSYVTVPKTALEFAIIYGWDDSTCRDIIKILTEYGADVNVVDPVTGKTPLHLALVHLYNKYNNHERITVLGAASIIKYLLRCNANVNALDSRGRTPLCSLLNEYISFFSYPLIISNPDPSTFQTFDFEACKILIASITKMIVKKECVIEENLNLLEERYLRPVFEECMNEIKCMKRNICESSNFSFLCILTKNIDVVGHAFTKEDLWQALNESHYIEEFPIYAEDLEERIWMAKLRHSMVELDNELFNKIVKENFRYEFREICKYLNLEDLNNLAEACSVKLSETPLPSFVWKRDGLTSFIQNLLMRLNRHIEHLLCS